MVNTKVLLAAIAATLIGSPSAMAGYDFTTLTSPTGTLFRASGINDTGEVVGSYTDASGTHGFSLIGGVFSTLDFHDATTTVTTTNANGVNGGGEIIGSFNDSHGFVLNGTMYTQFDVPSTVGTTTRGFGINMKGQLVGTFVNGTSFGFVATGLPLGGNLTLINAPPPLPAGPLTGVGVDAGINDAGTVVGSYADSTTRGTHGFLAIGASTMTLDDPLAPPGGVTAATGINNVGDIVGYFIDAGGITHGFVDAGGVYTTIDYPHALRFTRVLGVNDLGDLVGDYIDAGGVRRGFVASLTVPEPNTLALLGISLAGTMILRRQRKSGIWWRTSAS